VSQISFQLPGSYSESFFFRALFPLQKFSAAPLRYWVLSSFAALFSFIVRLRQGNVFEFLPLP